MKQRKTELYAVVKTNFSEKGEIFPFSLTSTQGVPKELSSRYHKTLQDEMLPIPKQRTLSKAKKVPIIRNLLYLLCLK